MTQGLGCRVQSFGFKGLGSRPKGFRDAGLKGLGLRDWDFCCMPGGQGGDFLKVWGPEKRI